MCSLWVNLFTNFTHMQSCCVARAVLTHSPRRPNRRVPMANLNKVMLIGRLTRDPEVRMFSNGGKVAKFGFAVNNRRKNQQSGQWEDEPVFLDVEAFNRGEFGKQADLVEQYLRKGSQVFIEGHLKFEQWTSQ